MRKAMLLGIGVMAMAAAGCGKSHAEDGGPTVQRNYQVGAFDKIEVAGPYDVTVRTGSGPTVSASGPEKAIEQLVVEVKGDKLVIHTKERRGGWFNWGSHNFGNTSLQVTVPALSAAMIAGSGGITVDKVAGDRFDGGVAGSGDLTLESLQVQSLKLSIGGSGDVRARSGQAASADYSIAGSGDIDAGGVVTQTADASIAGSGSIRAQATGTANAKIMGSGDITLTGGAKCSISKMGSGDVSCS
jgi:hypothetical protein